MEGPADGYSAIASRPSTPFRTEPTDRDRFYFNLCRTLVGVVVLGLTAINTVLISAPLFFESAFSHRRIPANTSTVHAVERRRHTCDKDDPTDLRCAGHANRLLGWTVLVLPVLRPANQMVKVKSKALKKSGRGGGGGKKKSSDNASAATPTSVADIAIPYAPAPFSGVAPPHAPDGVDQAATLADADAAQPPTPTQ